MPVELLMTWLRCMERAVIIAGIMLHQSAELPQPALPHENIVALRQASCASVSQRAGNDDYNSLILFNRGGLR